LTKYFIWRN